MPHSQGTSMTKIPRIKGTFKSTIDDDWFVITVDKHQLAIIMAGLKALTKYEGDVMKMPEHTLVKDMYDSMATSLGEAVLKTKVDD